MDAFYLYVVRSTDSALLIEKDFERQGAFQNLISYLKEAVPLLFPSEREDIQNGQSQRVVAAALDVTSEENRESDEDDRDPNTSISPFQQMVWRLKKPKHFLGIIYLLATEARTAFVSSDAFSKKNVLDSVTYFLRQYKPEQPLADINCLREQAMSVPCIFRKLCMGYALIMREEGRALEAIVPLQAAVEMSRPAPETVAKMYGVGARWIDTHLPLKVPLKGTLVGLKPLHLLHYLYFAGVIMIGCKRCQDALHYFKSVQDADSACRYLNGVTMEAYKKSILLVLTIDEAAALEYTDLSYELQNRSPGVLPYINIAKGYASGDTPAVCKAILSASSELVADGNMGLAKAVKAALIRRKIYCLKHVYVTISLQCITTQVGLSTTEEVENQILSLVESGEMAAVIDHSSGMVTFDKENCETHNRNDEIMSYRIENNIRLIMKLVQRVRPSRIETLLTQQQQQ